MKAIVQREYGSPLDVLRLEDVDDPAVGPTDVLVRVGAAGVNAADWHLVTGMPYVIRVAGMGLRPKEPVPGREVAGRVEAVGRDVTRLRPGDEVFGWSTGAFAELVAAPEDHFAPTPANLSTVQAAAVPLAALTALQGLRDQGRVQAGHRVLVTGASGGVGTFAVQLAKSLGAHVTGVCSTRNLEMVRAIGADEVIDYTREQVPGSGHRYDVILHVAGPTSLASMRRALTREGALVLVNGEGGRWLGPLPLLARARAVSAVIPQRFCVYVAKETGADLVAIADLLASGAVTPVIDRTYDLSEAPSAVHYLQEGHTQGKVVIPI